MDIVRAAGAGASQPNEGARPCHVKAAMCAHVLCICPDPPPLLAWLDRTELYGVVHAARIAALEAAVQARYAKALAGGKANLWPCEPLRNAP